jgi:hypothetical protein
MLGMTWTCQKPALTARNSGCDCDGNRAKRLFQNSSIGKPLPRVLLLPVPLPMADSRWRPGAGPPNPLPGLPNCSTNPCREGLD